MDAGRPDDGGVAGAILGGLAAVVGCLVSLFVSLVVPVLILLAILRGPGETWRLVEENVLQAGDGEPCPGFDAWWEASVPRQERALDEVERLARREIDTPEEFRATSLAFRQMAREQARSTPPAEAEHYNELMVGVFDGVADMAGARAIGDFLAFRDAQRHFETVFEEGDAEERRLLQRCMEL